MTQETLAQALIRSAIRNSLIEIGKCIQGLKPLPSLLALWLLIEILEPSVSSTQVGTQE